MEGVRFDYVLDLVYVSVQFLAELLGRQRRSPRVAFHPKDGSQQVHNAQTKKHRSDEYDSDGTIPVIRPKSPRSGEEEDEHDRTNHGHPRGPRLPQRGEEGAGSFHSFIPNVAPA